MKKLEQEIFSDKSKIFKWPPFFYIHRYTPNFFIKRLQIVYIFFFYMSPDWEGLRRGWIHPFFNKNVIFDENLWFFKNFFSLKMIKKQFPIHPSFQNKCLKSNSKIFKSHQIQPIYRLLVVQSATNDFKISTSAWACATEVRDVEALSLFRNPSWVMHCIRWHCSRNQGS